MSLMLSRRTKLGAGAVAALVSDAFNRADSTTTLGNADTGQAWSPSVANSWGITGNRAYLSTTSGDAGYLATVSAGQATQDATIDIQVPAAAGGLLFRVVDFSNHLLFDLNKVTNAWTLYKAVAGGYTSLASAPFTVNGTTIYTLRCTVTAAHLITCFIDGAQVGQVTDSANSTGQGVGMRVYHDANVYFGTEPRFDNLRVVAP